MSIVVRFNPTNVDRAKYDESIRRLEAGRDVAESSRSRDACCVRRREQHEGQ